MQERRLAAIMFTDIVGYTALMGSDEDRAFEVLAKNREIHIKLVEQFGGALIKEMGDGMLVSFNLASDAVRCAIEIQKVCKKKDIPLKIGIHEGEMVFAGNDVLGDGVNIASRLQEDAQEGCITISGSVYRDIKNKAGIKTEFIGEKSFKNVDEPVKVYNILCDEDVDELSPPSISRQASGRQPGSTKNKLLYYIIAGLVVLIAAVLIWYSTKERLTQELEKSIAVLPFTTITKDSTSQYIADGVREAILNNLQKIEDLEVGSRTSSETYRNSNKRIPEIASELGVATVMEGSAQKFGDQIRITIQLIDGKTDNHIWSEDYDRVWGDIFAIYTEIAEEVATALQVVITPDEKQQIAIAPTTDVTAYDYILQAREEQWKYWSKRDTIALRKAEKLYDKVMKLDPEYAPSWMYKGSIYMDRHAYTQDYYKKNFLDSVIWYCDKAIAFDPEYDHAYFLKGMVFHQRGNIGLAIKNYEKALVLSQNDAAVIWETLWRLGYINIFKKDYIKGLSLIRKAVQKARGSPQDYRHMLSRLGHAYMYIGAFEEAKKYFDKARNLGGWCINFWYLDLYQGNFQALLDYLPTCCTNTGCNYHKANNYLQLKKFEKSVEYFRKIRERREESGGIQWNNLYREGFALIQMGKKKEGMKLIEKQLSQLEIRKELRRSDGYDYHYAAIYASRGDQERALKHLRDYEESIIFLPPNENLISISFIQYDIMFENLWDNEEFQAIVKRDQDEKAAARAQLKEMEERGELDL